MALTDLLHNRRPSWRDWFEAHFPAVEPLQKAFREQVAAVADRHDQPRHASPLTLSLSGTGFEHRIRYMLDDEPPLDLATRGSLTLAGGAHQTEDDRRRLHEVFHRFLDDHRARVAGIRPANRTLPEADERRLAADCVVLGLLEQPVRVGDSRPPVLGRHLAELRSPDDLLAVVPAAVIDDMVAMSAVAIARLGRLRDASSSMGVAARSHGDGANAEMIIGDLLLVLRITTRPSLHREWLYQLLGSVLLASYPADPVHRVHRRTGTRQALEGGFEIRTAGFYLPRQDALVTWPVEELVSTAAGDPDVSVDRACEEFHAYLAAATAEPQMRAVGCG